MRLDAILDDRRQVGQQGLEAMDRFAGGSALGARLGAGLRRDLGGLRRVRIGVLEQQRGEPPLHVPLDVVGQHADEHVGAHAVFQVVVDRADLQVHRLEAAEGALDGAEALVGAHGVGRPEFVGRHAGADHVEAVQGRLGVDAGLVAAVGEVALLDGEFEMLADLELGDDLADLEADAGGAAQGPPDALGGGDDRVEQFLGGLQQGLALAGALGGQQGVAAQQQALAGKVRGSDFGEVLVVEEGHLDGALAGEFADGGGAQGGDPVKAGGAQFVADAGLGEQAAVADDHQAGEAEAATQGVELGADGGGIGGVAGEDLNGDGAAVAVAQQGEDDLELAALAVAGMAAGGEGAVGALEVGGGDVGEDEGGVAEMAFGEGLLDGVLAGQEPVHGGVEVVGSGLAELEFVAEGVGQAGGAEAAGGGELGARLEDA